MTIESSSTSDIVNDETTDAERVQYFTAPNGFPVVLTNHVDILKWVKQDHPEWFMYYLLGDKVSERIEYDVWVTNEYNHSVKKPVHTFYDHSLALFKVIYNEIGYSVTEVHADALESIDLTPIKEGFGFVLPKIPKELLDRVDQFLRLVDEKQRSEAIVLLTFDPLSVDNAGNFEPKGWGVLVPDQVNTAAHCKYDQTTIIDDKPDHVMIVGSIHSHPQMSAYASGTDHEDQSDFDGIHITFGWRGNGPTEYYIEYQMQNRAWRMFPDQVFEDFVKVETPDDDMKTWIDRVSTPGKAQTAQSPIPLGPKVKSGQAATSGSDAEFNNSEYEFTEVGFASYSDVHTMAWRNHNSNWNPCIALKNYNYEHYVLVTDIEETTLSCPACFKTIAPREREMARCTRCWTFFKSSKDTLDDLITHRRSLSLDVSDLIQDYKHNKGVCVWTTIKKIKEGKTTLFDEFETVLEYRNPEDDVLPLV